MNVQRNIEARYFNHCCSGKAMSITSFVCISVPLDIQSMQFASAVLYYLWPVPFYNYFPHYLINGTIFEKKILLFNLKCVF